MFTTKNLLHSVVVGTLWHQTEESCTSTHSTLTSCTIPFWRKWRTQSAKPEPQMEVHSTNFECRFCGRDCTKPVPELQHTEYSSQWGFANTQQSLFIFSEPLKSFPFSVQTRLRNTRIRLSKQHTKVQSFLCFTLQFTLKCC